MPTDPLDLDAIQARADAATGGRMRLAIMDPENRPGRDRRAIRLYCAGAALAEESSPSPDISLDSGLMLDLEAL